MIYCWDGHRLVYDGVRDFQIIYKCPHCGRKYVVVQYTLEEVK